MSNLKRAYTLLRMEQDFGLLPYDGENHALMTEIMATNLPQVKPLKIVVDSCYLMPILTRHIFCWLHLSDVIAVTISDRIAQETTHQMAKYLGNHPEDYVRVQTNFALGLFEHYASEGAKYDLPDPDDCHVLEAAIASKSAIILTDNLKDFPITTLDKYGITRQRADQFLCNHINEVAPVLALMRRTLGLDQPNFAKLCRERQLKKLSKLI